MKEVTKDMIRLYQIKDLGYDFMGYTFVNLNQLSFHHLIVPKRDCKKNGFGDGYLEWNGAILRQDTSHDYLHLIERIDRSTFLAITDLIIKENRNKKIDLETLRSIRELLLSFEDKYKEETIFKNGKSKKLIKRAYTEDRIIL